MRAIDVLVVCTGNICRSPMAEALLDAHLRARGATARVHSAGTMAWSTPPTPEAVAVMREHGLDISEHRPRQLTAELADGADLVLGMTRDHVGRIVAVAPHAADRTFLIGELVRLGERLPRHDGESLREWASRVAAARPHRRMLGHSTDEVRDPLGEPIDVFRTTATHLDRGLWDVAALLAPGS